MTEAGDNQSDIQEDRLGFMKAAVLFRPNDLRVVSIKKPSVLDKEEVLLKVRACAICGSDLKLISKPVEGHPTFGEYVPGHEYVGDIIALGSSVSEFKVGERVATQVHKGCMRCENCISGNYTACLNYGDVGKGHRAYGITVNGGFAEYAVNHCSTIFRVPDKISYAEATIITTAGTALYAIDLAETPITGKSITVFGPGPIGLMLVQLLRVYGASNIALVGTRRNRLTLGKRFGADHTFVQNEEGLVDKILMANGNRKYDLVFDCAGASQAVDIGLNILKRNSKLVLIGYYIDEVRIDLNRLVWDKISLVGVRGEGNRSCNRVIELARQNRLDLKSLITHEYPLEDINEAIDVYRERKGDAVKVVIVI